MLDRKYHWYGIVMQTGNQKGNTGQITTSSLIGRATKTIPESVPQDTIERMGLDPDNTVFLNAFYRGYMTLEEVRGDGPNVGEVVEQIAAETLREAAAEIRAGSEHATPEDTAKMLEAMAAGQEE